MSDAPSEATPHDVCAWSCQQGITAKPTDMPSSHRNWKGFDPRFLVSMSSTISPSVHTTCAGTGAFENVVLALYQYVIPKPKAECTKTEQLGVSFLAGYIAGVFCAVVSQPADNLVHPAARRCCRTPSSKRLPAPPARAVCAAGVVGDEPAGSGRARAPAGPPAHAGLGGAADAGGLHSPMPFGEPAGACLGSCRQPPAP